MVLGVYGHIVCENRSTSFGRVERVATVHSHAVLDRRSRISESTGSSRSNASFDMCRTLDCGDNSYYYFTRLKSRSSVLGRRQLR